MLCNISAIVNVCQPEKPMDQMSLLKELRTRLRMSQEAFARAIEKSVASVRGYESGRRPPPQVLARMVVMAGNARFKDLCVRIENLAAELYDVGPFVPPVFLPPQPHPGPEPDPVALHLELDYIFNSAPPDIRAALCETLRAYSIAAGLSRATRKGEPLVSKD